MNNRRKQLMLASAKEYCKCVVEGKTLKYNQLFDIDTNAGFSYGTQYNGITLTKQNGRIIINGTSTDGCNFLFYSYHVVKGGHKYFRINLRSNGLGMYDDYEIDDTSVVVAESDNDYLSMTIKNGKTFNNYVFNGMFIDLTELGLDSINSVADFYETDLGKYVAKGNYLPYEPNGKFIHAQSPINFKGVNIWNEQYRGGCYDTTNGDYNSFSSDYEICSKDKIRVKPNTKYYVYCGKVEIGNYAVFYDKNNNFLGYCYYVSNNAEYCVKTPDNAYYMNITFGTEYGVTYLHDICISENVWNENWEIGAINTGSGDNNETNDNVRSAGYIKIEPNQRYYFSSLSHHCSAFFYGKNKEYLGDDFVIGDIYNGYFVSPNNAYYIRFYTWEGNTYNNDIAIFYYGYQRYCGNSVFESGLTLYKGDKYKSWGLDDIEYNNQNSMPKGTITGWQTIASASVVGGHKYLVYAKYSRPSNAPYQDTDYQVYITGLESSYIYDSNATPIIIATCTQSGTCEFNSATYSNFADAVDYQIMLIDLTLLGLDNITSVADFNKTKLGMFLSKGYYLSYTTTNKTIKDQIVRTFKEIDLSALTWTSEDVGMVAKLPSDFKTFEGNELASVIAEKYKTAKYYDEIQDSICIVDVYGYGYSVVIRYGNTTPSGKALLELETPEIITDYPMDFVLSNDNLSYDDSIFGNNGTIFELPNGLIPVLENGIPKLEIIGDEIGFVGIEYGNTPYPSQEDVYYANGFRMSENQIAFTTTNNDGSNVTNTDERVYLVGKTLRVWVTTPRDIPDIMISRRTINVESENEIDLDFTKE